MGLAKSNHTKRFTNLNSSSFSYTIVQGPECIAWKSTNIQKKKKHATFNCNLNESDSWESETTSTTQEGLLFCQYEHKVMQAEYLMECTRLSYIFKWVTRKKNRNSNQPSLFSTIAFVICGISTAVFALAPQGSTELRSFQGELQQRARSKQIFCSKCPVPRGTPKTTTSIFMIL